MPFATRRKCRSSVAFMADACTRMEPVSIAASNASGFMNDRFARVGMRSSVCWPWQLAQCCSNRFTPSSFSAWVSNGINKVAAIMDAGELVTDEIVIGLIEEQLDAHPEGGFIFDGFPRTLAQADALGDLLA